MGGKRSEKSVPVVPVAAMPRPVMPGYVVGMFCGYLLLLPVSYFALLALNEWGGGSAITPDRALFAVVNAATLSGFQSIIGIGTYSAAAQGVVLALTFVGIAFSLVVGGLAVVRILGLPYSDARIVRVALGTSGAIIALGWIPLIGRHEPLEALMLSAGSFGNSGLYFGRLPGVADWRTHVVLLPLAVAGGLGVTVLMELYDAALRRRAVSEHTRTVLGMTAWVYLTFFAACLLLQLAQREEGAAFWPIVWSSSAASVNTRTLGYPIPFAQDFPATVQWVLLLSMLIGGSPGGTAGGVKTTTLAALGRGVRAALRGGAAGKPFAAAALWVAGYLAVAFVVFLMLLATVPQVVPERLLFLAVSAVGNVGLSHEVISFVSPGSRVLAVAMLFGRLAPLLVLWWMAQTGTKTELATA